MAEPVKNTTRRPALFWRIFPSMLLITALSLLALTWYASRIFGDYHRLASEEQLEKLALLTSARLAVLWPVAPSALQDKCLRGAELVGARFTVVDPRGNVLADSSVDDPRALPNHGARPEFARALAGGLGCEVRYSSTLRRDMLYVAVPVELDGAVVGAVRMARPLALLKRQKNALSSQIAIAGGIAGFFALLFSVVLTRGISRPLQSLERGVARFANGDLGTHLPAYSTAEMDRLAHGINSMADQLASRLQAIRAEHNELETIVSSMGEGLMAIDLNRQVIKANQAAATMLGVVDNELIGRPLNTVLRNSTLEELVAKTLGGDETVEGEATLYGEPDRIVRLHGTQLVAGDGSRAGAVVVLDDVTRLRRLEAMRRQFASNVSHELKTPITSIQGFVETLLDGALEESPEDVRRFLEIILRQTRRLNTIMEDILLLSRIEQSNEELRKGMEWLDVATVVAAAIGQCREAAAERTVALSAACPQPATIRAHPRLIEQAVVNLLSNAINYSPEGSEVVVRVDPRADGGVDIRVVDHGLGIAREHLPRLFERFYRVDKARSRQLGGTGLGLAIVKHIMQVHGGRVSVDSEVGKGSTFTLALPPVAAT